MMTTLKNGTILTAEMRLEKGIGMEGTNLLLHACLEVAEVAV